MGQNNLGIPALVPGALPMNPPAETFPPQFSGLRVYDGVAVREISLVAAADALAGDRVTVRKGGVNYAVYLVPTTDARASKVRVSTDVGTRSMRIKT